MPVTASRLLAALAIAAAIAGPARAQDPAPDPRDRTLVLVAPPAVLLDAVQTSLAPWQIRIVVIDAAEAPPAEIATANHAGFVAVGAGGVLHLYDRGAATEQVRPMPADLGEADAAALALTIKTWMRLGPAPVVAPLVPAPPPEPEIVRPAPTPVRGWRIEATAALGVRANQGGLDELHARVLVGVGVATSQVDVAVGVELGPAVDVMDNAQPGEWRESVAFARVSRRFALPRSLVLRPIAGLAVMRGTADGVQAASSQRFAMVSWTAGIDGAAELGWRRGRLAGQVVAGITAVPMAQQLHDRNVRFDVPAHLEPWAAIGVQAQF